MSFIYFKYRLLFFSYDHLLPSEDRDERIKPKKKLLTPVDDQLGHLFDFAIFGLDIKNVRVTSDVSRIPELKRFKLWISNYFWGEFQPSALSVAESSDKKSSSPRTSRPLEDLAPGLWKFLSTSPVTGTQRRQIQYDKKHLKSKLFKRTIWGTLLKLFAAF